MRNAKPLKDRASLNLACGNSRPHHTGFERGQCLSLRQCHAEACHQPSVNLELCSCAKTCAIARQKGDDLSDFFRAPDSAERLRLTPFPKDFFLSPRRGFSGRKACHWCIEIGRASCRERV